MRKYVSLLLGMTALLATAVVGIAGAAGGNSPVTVKVGELEVTSNFKFTPTAASKTKQTPIAVDLSGEVKMEKGGHPPAARELLIESDKNAEIHSQGIPVCKSGEIQATDTAAALEACGPALIGEGTTTAEVEFAEQRPVEVPSKLLLFNGGEKGGKTTWLAHAFFSQPISGAIVTTATITKIDKGRFGTLSVVKVPQIAGGFGSIVSFELEIFKSVKVGGKTYNPISAVCTDGKAKVHVQAKFEDGTKAETEVIRACTPKG